ncbi:hypothetical protein PCA20602_02153 [Pandoraea capi]|uniref:Uncharacterized protein n=1 Tax=Pandoraea capi TaxID=2508286 RepID=A0ABY6VXM8_9BURK|nr:hypothetical protein [Pandoraea capi]VVE01384.1 hypothetical protein PCA20602_02153 [Pandoraea capi]
MHVNAGIGQGNTRFDWRRDDIRQRADTLPEAGTFGVFGAVVGHDGSGAPLPDIGPYDFSSAMRVCAAAPMGSAGSAIRMSLSTHGVSAASAASLPHTSPTSHLAPADAPQYVVKACPSAGHAAQAWLASRLFGALGLATPTAILVRGCSQAFDGTQAPERLYLATTFLETYRNLGDWLESDDAWRVIGGAHPPDVETLQHARGQARAAGQRMAQAVETAGGLPFYHLDGEMAQVHAEALGHRIAMRRLLCHALPDVYQCALERHYIAALWLGNWDLCNVFMENIGVWRDKNDLPYVMSLDFDACLDLAFQHTRKVDGYDVALNQRKTLTSLPPLTSTFRREAASFAATLPDDALADLTQFPYGEHYAPFVRRLSGLSGAACDVTGKAMSEALRNPNGVRALAAEMAYRLGRISSQEMRRWATRAHEVAYLSQSAQTSQTTGHTSCDTMKELRDPEALVVHLLMRRDSLVRLLGGSWAAQTWARMYPMRAQAIDAQQEPFGCPRGV